MNKETIPYIVSADVNRLMQTWALENRYTVPNEEYFRGMLLDLERVLNSYFDSVEVLPETYLATGMANMAAQSKLPVISLDRAYVDINLKNLVGFIDITRTVDGDLNNRGLSERPGTPPIERQINQIICNLTTNRVALLDDVLFEGGTHTSVAEWLKAKNIIVEEVLVGVAIKEGAEKLALAGINVQSLFSYDTVIDEICERDFIAGAPMSGRTVVTNSGEVMSAPYLYPFGKPEKWASIPSEHSRDFSDFCLAQAIMLWEKVDKLSRATISTQEVPRVIFNLEPGDSIVKSLKKTKNTK